MIKLDCVIFLCPKWKDRMYVVPAKFPVYYPVRWDLNSVVHLKIIDLVAFIREHNLDTIGKR